MDNKIIRRNSVKIFALCFFAYSSVYVGRKNFGACMNAMIGDGVITETFGGAILTAFLAAYATGQLVNGLLGDRFPQRFMISTGLMGAGCINILMGLNSANWLFLVLWCLCGVFCSMLWSSIIRCISDWIPDDFRTTAGTNLSPSIPLGTVASYLICSLVLKLANWRAVFVVCGSVLILASLFFFFSIGRMKPYISEMEKVTRSAVKATNVSGGNAKKRGNIISVVLTFGISFTVIGILFNGILKDGLESWVPTYITASFGASEALSSLLTTALPIVSLAGVYIAKWVYSRFCSKNEMLTSGVLFTVSAILMIPIVVLTSVDLSGIHGTLLSVIMIAAVLVIAVVISLMLGINSLYLTFIPLCFGRIGRASSVTGFLNACSYAAASISGIAIGFISQNFGWTATISVFAIAATMGAVVGYCGSGIWKNGKEKLAGEDSVEKHT